jgi:bifunctional N-acetylglucosamine-1-phosphate-uridyltransferase/glucosamine-1-phosphate-acetyltransferase GlmU-like protein
MIGPNCIIGPHARLRRVITEDLPPGALAIARQRQVTKQGHAATTPHARKGKH